MRTPKHIDYRHLEKNKVTIRRTSNNEIKTSIKPIYFMEATEMLLKSIFAFFSSSSQLPRFPKAVHHRWQNSPSIYLTETAGAPCGFSYPLLGGRSYTLPRTISFEALGPCLQPVTPGRRGPWVNRQTKGLRQRKTLSWTKVFAKASYVQMNFHLASKHVYIYQFILEKTLFTTSQSFSKYRNLPMF